LPFASNTWSRQTYVVNECHFVLSLIRTVFDRNRPIGRTSRPRRCFFYCSTYVSPNSHTLRFRFLRHRLRYTSGFRAVHSSRSRSIPVQKGSKSLIERHLCLLRIWLVPCVERRGTRAEASPKIPIRAPVCRVAFSPRSVRTRFGVVRGGSKPEGDVMAFGCRRPAWNGNRTSSAGGYSARPSVRAANTAGLIAHLIARRRYTSRRSVPRLGFGIAYIFVRFPACRVLF